MKMKVTQISTEVNTATTPETRTHRIFLAEVVEAPAVPGITGGSSMNLTLTEQQAAGFAVGTVCTMTVTPDA